jgi:hypothetical protein
MRDYHFYGDEKARLGVSARGVEIFIFLDFGPRWVESRGRGGEIDGGSGMNIVIET